MKVKRLCQMLVTVLTLTIAAAACNVAQADSYSDQTTRLYTANSNEEVQFIVSDGVITGYSGVPRVLSIPSTIDGQTVTSIGDFAFAGCSSLLVITIPDSVTSIGQNAFSRCSSLLGVTIPNNVTSIGSSAFAGCSMLSDVTIPDGVTSIAPWTFNGCVKLRSVIIPDSVTSIGNGAFYGCSQELTSITIPGSVLSIGSSAFYGCSSLTSVTIHEGVIDIGTNAFSSCSALTSVSLPSSLEHIGDYAFYGCNNITSLELGDQMSEIGENAIPTGVMLIIGNESPLLEEIRYGLYRYSVRESNETNVVPDTATTVSQKVRDIVAAVIHPNMTDYQKALALHNWLILNADYNESITYYDPADYSAEGVLLNGKGVCESYADAYQLLLNEVGIPNALEHGTSHVWNMIKLDGEWYHVDVTWDDPTGGGTEQLSWFGLSNYALENVRSHECTERVHIATSYEYNYAYRKGLLDSMISDVESGIRDNLDQGLENFTLKPASFSGIFDYGIRERTVILAMQNRTIRYGDRRIHFSISMDSNYSITVSVLPEVADFCLPKGLVEIDAEAFAGIRATYIDIPTGVISIGERAFADCIALHQVNIPASVTEIDSTAFEGVTGLRIIAPSGSAAESFAKSHDAIFIADD